jgi:hypothetical protein
LANQSYVGAGKPPSAWAIVIVAAILILLPSLFCAGIMLSANSGAQTAPER